MCDDGYQYVLELFKRPTGALLGRVPIRADWEPIREALALDVSRRSVSEDFSAVANVHICPQWQTNAAGRLIRGVRATVGNGHEASDSMLVPIDYFRDHAQRAADAYVETGELEPGDRFEYRVLAIERPRATAKPRISVEATATPVAITNASLEDFTSRALLVGADSADDVPAFVHWRVMEEASILTRQAGALETGGVLIGHVCRDSSLPELFLEVTAQIPAPAHSQLTKLSFCPDTWSAVHAAVQERGQGEVWLGWWHSHSFFKEEQAPTGDEHASRKRSDAPFLSAEDMLLHRTVFPRAYSLAFLMTDSPRSGLSWSMFGWRAGKIVPREFHLIHAPMSEAFTPLRGIQHATP